MLLELGLDALALVLVLVLGGVGTVVESSK